MEAANPQFQVMFRQEQQFIGRNLSEIAPDFYVQGLGTLVDAVFESGVPQTGREVKLEFTGRNPQFLTVICAPLCDSNGEVNGIVVEVHDRAEQVLIREQLELSEHHYGRLFERAPMGIWVVDPRGRTSSVNPKLMEMLGYSEEEMIGRRLQDLWADETDPDREALFERRRQGLGERSERRYHRKDGSILWADVCGFPLMDASGECLGIVGMLTDISERKGSEERLWLNAHLLDQVEAAVIAVDLAGKILHWNRHAEKLYGWTRDEVLGTHIGMVTVGPEDQSLGLEIMREVLCGGSWEGEFMVRRKDGSSFPAYVTNSRFLNVEGQIAGVIGVSVDITARRRVEEALRTSEAFARSTLDALSAHIAILDSQGIILAVNKAWRDFAASNSAQGSSAYEGANYLETCDRVVDVPEAALFAEGIRLVASAQRETFELEYACDSSTEERWFIGRVSRFHGESPRRIVVAHENITSRKQLENELKYRSLHDPLTGLSNRFLFMDRLQHVLDRSARQSAVSAVLFLDLDRFKVINDSLGHLAGDRLLIDVGKRLQKAVRPADSVARFGGDEFGLLFEDVGSTDCATRLAERILKDLTTPFIIEGHQVVVTASIGMVLTHGSQEEPIHLLRDADIAMYRAKRLGRSRCEIFEFDPSDVSLERLKLEVDLRRAIEMHEFLLHYQPIVDLRTGSIAKIEALIRWQSPSRGMVSPAEFIPLTEETGMILPIGTWVLETACRQLKQWQTRFPPFAGLTMSVNMSLRQFRQKNLVDEVARILDETGLEPHCLVLEMTETAVMDNAPMTIAALGRLKLLGVEVGIDDFGTGYSSLSYLKRFPVDVLKIDKSFIDGLGRDAEDTAIVGAIIGLGHSLGLELTAEGVETVEQLLRLQNLGCEHAQGYWLSRPLTPAQLEAHLVDNGVSIRERWREAPMALRKVSPGKPLS